MNTVKYCSNMSTRLFSDLPWTLLCNKNLSRCYVRVALPNFTQHEPPLLHRKVHPHTSPSVDKPSHSCSVITKSPVPFPLTPLPLPWSVHNFCDPRSWSRHQSTHICALVSQDILCLKRKPSSGHVLRRSDKQAVAQLWQQFGGWDVVGRNPCSRVWAQRALISGMTEASETRITTSTECVGVIRWPQS